MKTVLVAVITLLLGFMLGGLGPRSDLRAAKDELSKARAAADAARGSALPLALGSLMAARERADEQGARATKPAAPSPAAATPSPAAASADDGEEKDAGEPDGGRRRMRALGEPTMMAAAKAAADLRAAQFKTAFVEEAHLAGVEQTKLDDVIKKMNEEFTTEADKVAKLLEEKGEKMSPRDMADVGVGLLQVYQRADDSFQSTLSPDQKAAADKTRFDILTQVDVAAFQKLADAAAKLEKPPRALR